MLEPMRFAYADPPYYGCGRRYYSHHPEAAAWDDQATHLALVERLVDEFPDGWALSCNTRDLRWLLPACPEDVRIGSWVKPFGSGYKPGIRVSYTWEPVIWRGGRKRHEAGEPITRDTLTSNATRQLGLVGAKPAAFNRWVLDLLGYQDGDELVDLFPGTGGMAAAANQGRLL
jgi:hypothetical protein